MGPDFKQVKKKLDDGDARFLGGPVKYLTFLSQSGNGWTRRVVDHSLIGLEFFDFNHLNTKRSSVVCATTTYMANVGETLYLSLLVSRPTRHFEGFTYHVTLTRQVQSLFSSNCLFFLGFRHFSFLFFPHRRLLGLNTHPDCFCLNRLLCMLYYIIDTVNVIQNRMHGSSFL